MSESPTEQLVIPNVVPAENHAYRKAAWHILPLLMLCYVVAYLDRVNVGFAKLQMADDLQFSEAVYGFGAGIFFIAYFFLEIPSNLMLHRVGARLWIARIMITWGIISAGMAFVTTPMSFYVMRCLLGIAEAGFYPGVILYLSYWFPTNRRGRMYALFATAVPLSGVIGAPLSGWIMGAFNGLHGFAGWQWMFILEGIPSVLIGILVIFKLTDRISHAKWLTDEEKKILQANIDSDTQHHVHSSLKEIFLQPRVWLLTLIYFCLIAGFYTIGFWLPTLIKDSGVKDVLSIGLLSAIPYGAAALTMIVVSRSADRWRERRWHLALTATLGGIGMIISASFSDNIVIAMMGLTLGAMGALSTLPLFWSLPTAFLGGTAAAAGIALINSWGNLAGFAAPYMMGYLKDLTQSTTTGMLIISTMLFIGAALVFLVPAKTVNR
ncbi:MFS transporter [Yersinia intermedia]|jgi:D-galactonate transporter|uniref:Putative tartrate transporter n=1 Tax=Yersinia intermedia TaxID=631 RepID=A0A209A085_YERIN|nr:MFS transporter [Yersinia intermedia]MCB5314728.1 MFS transporter [Yersinia intermedia]MCB5322636.1 MFS transporter [Yersinia intermedia]MCB5328566.1 MFS transporter [Yersinia intermedia]OVZ86152.1 MFS transporter [Yersinia intermedia]UNK23877.1 MFS transporter [Yersinia intermedia]